MQKWYYHIFPFAFYLFTFAFSLFLSHVFCAQVFEKFLQVVRVAVASGLDAEQDAAAAYARVINFGAMFRDACADQSANESAGGCAGAQAGKRCGNWPGNHDAQ